MRDNNNNNNNNNNKNNNNNNNNKQNRKHAIISSNMALMLSSGAFSSGMWLQGPLVRRAMSGSRAIGAPSAFIGVGCANEAAGIADVWGPVGSE